jgi:hypothetical protein
VNRAKRFDHLLTATVALYAVAAKSLPIYVRLAEVAAKTIANPSYRAVEALQLYEPIAEMSTFLDTIPGVDAAWTILGILESLIFILIVVSLIRLEFLPDRRKSFLLCSLGLAIFTFSILAMGQSVVGENSGVAELFI